MSQSQKALFYELRSSSICNITDAIAKCNSLFLCGETITASTNRAVKPSHGQRYGLGNAVGSEYQDCSRDDIYKVGGGILVSQSDPGSRAKDCFITGEDTENVKTEEVQAVLTASLYALPEV